MNLWTAGWVRVSAALAGISLRFTALTVAVPTLPAIALALSILRSRHVEICNGRLLLLTAPSFSHVCLSMALYHQGLLYSNSTNIFLGFLNASLTKL